jgi:hypothetical protein
MTTPPLSQFDFYTSIVPVPQRLSSSAANDHPDDRDILITQLLGYSPVSAMTYCYATTKSSTVRDVLEYFYRQWYGDTLVLLPQHYPFLFAVIRFLPNMVGLVRLKRGQELREIRQYHTFHISTSRSVWAAEAEFYVLLRDAFIRNRIASWWRKHVHALNLIS